MTTEFARTSLRLAAAAVIAGGLAACSTVESLDPTGMLGSDSSASDTGGIPAGDPGEQQQADQSGMGQPEAAASPDAAQPDVASIPDKPQAPTSDAENDQVASSLQADAANVQYSADSLRGGTEASAPPPGSAPAETPAPVQVAAAAPPPARTSQPASNVTPGTMGADAPAQPEAAPSPDSTGPLTEAPAQPAAAAPPSDAPDNTPIPEPEPVAEPDQTASAQAAAPAPDAPAQPEAAAQPEAPAQPEPAAAPAPQSVANAEAPAQPEPAASPDASPSAAPAPAPEPTQVASAAPVPGAQAPVTRRAAPGFAQSTAPALDPSVSQFVSAPVIARYKQTATLKPSVFPDYSARPGGAGPATATIMFPGDTTILDDKARQQVRAAAELYKSQGGKGYVRIVGYASASSGNLSSARLMQINFDHSQARATSIARALMKEGVPAKKVLVDAAPQSASVAKAEIFVQG